MEYAEEYTKKEKIVRLSCFILLGAFSIFAANTLFFPFVEDFAARPHCFTFISYNGADIIWHGLFIGMPLSLLLIVTPAMLPMGIKSLKQGQFPPAGTKVYKPTPIATGSKATIKALAFVLMPVLLLAFTVWGTLQVDKMPEIDKSKLAPAVCMQN